MRGLVAMIGAVLLAGCAKEDDAPPAACFASPATILSALERAPGAVTLGGGTRLSSCVGAARTDGDLQSLGLTLVRVADTLRAQAGSQPGAALRLGYVAGAVTAGAETSSDNIAAQLARRVEQVATLEPDAGAAAAAALARGREAGGRSG